MPPTPYSLDGLPTYNYQTILAGLWRDNPRHRSKWEWQRIAKERVDMTIAHRQHLFLEMAIDPLNYGYARCIDGKIQLVQP